MADLPKISKITLPSGGTYQIADAYARELLASGLNFSICYDGTSTPVVANIPAGVEVEYNGTTYTGTKPASSAEPLTFYLVKEKNNVYSEYVAIRSGGSGTAQDPYTYTWEKLGDTSLDLSDLGALAYKNTVTLNKGNGVSVVTPDTAMETGVGTVYFAGGTTDKVLGSDATFTTTVTPTTTNIKATASGTAVGANGTAAAITGFGTHTTGSALPSNATFTTDINKATKTLHVRTKDSTLLTNVGKLVTTTVPNVTGNTNVSIPNVTSVGSASTWSFAMGSGTNAETLIISGGNSTAPTLGTALSASKVTLGTAKTVATGSTASNGSGASIASLPSDSDFVSIPISYTLYDNAIDEPLTDVTVVTDITSASTTASGTAVNAITALGTPTTATVLTGVKVTTQPSISIAAGSGTGSYTVATGITSATTTTNNKDEVTAVTNIGTGTVDNISVNVISGTETVPKLSDLSVTVS